MTVIAIDPGSESSALIIWDGEAQAYGLKLYGANEMILDNLYSLRHNCSHPLVIEEVSCYGMPVGREVFQTVFWAGRFCEAFGSHRTRLMPRLTVKMRLCHNSRAKDGNIRQALIDRFGPQGTKKAPGTLYGIASHLWAALALAVTWYDQNESGIQRKAIS